MDKSSMALGISQELHAFLGGKLLLALKDSCTLLLTFALSILTHTARTTP